MTLEKFKLRSAVYLIPIKDNKVLLSRRFNTGWMDGKYSLISGHIDGNETVFEAMVREALEEADLKIDPQDLIPATVIHRKSDFEYIDFFFIVKQWQGTPTIKEPNKCDDLSWHSLNNLPNNLLPFITEAINNYQNKTAFFVSGWDR